MRVTPITRPNLSWNPTRENRRNLKVLTHSMRVPSAAPTLIQFYAMAMPVPMLTPREASRLIGISYPTIKQWILSGKLKTVQTPGGHHRIALATLKPYVAKDNARPDAESRARYRRVSGRNQIAGKIVSVRIEGLLAEVVIATGWTNITAIITSNAVRELRLKKGDSAAALIKSTDVMVERLEDPA
jgi:molybdopterin-binding protein